MPRRHAVFVGCLCACFAGCSGRDAEPLVPVAGKLRVAGAPVPGGYIMFHPDAGKGNSCTTLPHAEIGKDGSYGLSTNGKPGAPAGFYKVVVTGSKDPIPARPARNSDGSFQINWVHDVKYTTPHTTDLTVEVTPTNKSYDFDLSK